MYVCLCTWVPNWMQMKFPQSAIGFDFCDRMSITLLDLGTSVCLRLSFQASARFFFFIYKVDSYFLSFPFQTYGYNEWSLIMPLFMKPKVFEWVWLFECDLKQESWYMNVNFFCSWLFQILTTFSLMPYVFNVECQIECVCMNFEFIPLTFITYQE